MWDFDWGRRGDQVPVEHDRVLTLPNAVSLARLLALPVFVWVVLVAEALALGLGILVGVGVTDWVDGYLARRLDQVSKVGRVLDPLVDRAVVIVAAVTLLLAGLVPAWLVAVVVVRDVAVLGGAALLFGGVPPLRVTRVGKVGTASLLLALPVFVLAGMDVAGAAAAGVVAWIVAVAGLAAYLVSGVQYARQARSLRHARQEGSM